MQTASHTHHSVDRHISDARRAGYLSGSFSGRRLSPLRLSPLRRSVPPGGGRSCSRGSSLLLRSPRRRSVPSGGPAGPGGLSLWSTTVASIDGATHRWVATVADVGLAASDGSNHGGVPVCDFGTFGSTHVRRLFLRWWWIQGSWQQGILAARGKSMGKRYLAHPGQRTRIPPSTCRFGTRRPKRLQPPLCDAVRCTRAVACPRRECRWRS